MADQDPTRRGASVALNLPDDHVRFLRGVFTDARVGLRDELTEHRDDLKDPERLSREEAAYGRVLVALVEMAVVADAELLGVVSNLADVIDRSNEYDRVVMEHEALHGFLDQLRQGVGR